jgi:hypothetical protein
MVLQNMEVKDEKEIAAILNVNCSTTSFTQDNMPAFLNVLPRDSDVSASLTHIKLKRDLVEHIWKKKYFLNR